MDEVCRNEFRCPTIRKLLYFTKITLFCNLTNVTLVRRQISQESITDTEIVSASEFQKPNCGHISVSSSYMRWYFRPTMHCKWVFPHFIKLVQGAVWTDFVKIINGNWTYYHRTGRFAGFCVTITPPPLHVSTFGSKSVLLCVTAYHFLHLIHLVFGSY